MEFAVDISNVEQDFVWQLSPRKDEISDQDAGLDAFSVDSADQSNGYTSTNEDEIIEEEICIQPSSPNAERPKHSIQNTRQIIERKLLKFGKRKKESKTSLSVNATNSGCSSAPGQQNANSNNNISLQVNGISPTTELNVQSALLLASPPSLSPPSSSSSHSRQFSSSNSSGSGSGTTSKTNGKSNNNNNNNNNNNATPKNRPMMDPMTSRSDRPPLPLGDWKPPPLPLSPQQSMTLRQNVTPLSISDPNPSINNNDNNNNNNSNNNSSNSNTSISLSALSGLSISTPLISARGKSSQRLPTVRPPSASRAEQKAFLSSRDERDAPPNNNSHNSNVDNNGTQGHNKHHHRGHQRRSRSGSARPHSPMSARSVSEMRITGKGPSSSSSSSSSSLLMSPSSSSLLVQQQMLHSILQSPTPTDDNNGSYEKKDSAWEPVHRADQPINGNPPGAAAAAAAVVIQPSTTTTIPPSSSSSSSLLTPCTPIPVDNARACYAFFPAPRHITNCQKSEPFHVQRPGLVDELSARDLRRFSSDIPSKNRVVYDCFAPPPYRDSISSVVDPTTGFPWPYYVPADDDDLTLVFESRFESGNLRRAVQITDYEYDLMMRTDVYTNSYTQWFYFSITNMRPGIPYTFNLVNLYKSEGQYNNGLRPVMYSSITAQKENIGWQRVGGDIGQFQNTIRKTSDTGTSTLSFKIVFPFAGDTCYLAHSYPYTWTRLQRHLYALQQNDIHQKMLQRSLLCTSLAGNRVDLLTITNHESSPQEIAKRRGVMITARVHPGEPGASWIMEGITKYLLSQTPRAAKLRNMCVFKIIPMLNPDGVINGNYRCSLSGADLNRQWKHPHPIKHRPIYSAKETLRQFCSERHVVMYTDLHGHSHKKNVFMYGCEASGPLRFRERVFPLLFSQVCDAFSWSDCHFHIKKEKEACGRVVAFKEFDIINSYTLEASFAGPVIGSSKGNHFSIAQYQAIGCKFLESLLTYVESLQQSGDGCINELYSQILKAAAAGTLPNDEETKQKKKKKDKQKKKK